MEHDPPSSIFSLNGSALAEGTAALEALRIRWQDVNTKGEEIGTMAQLASEPVSQQLTSFPDAVIALKGARQQVALDALADIEMVLNPGLSALRNLKEQGSDVTAAALRLWCEFHRSREALLDIAGPQD